MATIKRFEELGAWKTARQRANAICDVTSEGPAARDFGFRDQIRRAGMSVMSNIAEDLNSRTQAIFADLLGRARGGHIARLRIAFRHLHPKSVIP